jgi:hypothetical protein
MVAMELEPLDEKGFVFLDGQRRPYLVRMWGDKPWLFYWHPDNHWVSYRQITQVEIWQFPRNLSQEKQDVYHKINQEWMKDHALFNM